MTATIDNYLNYLVPQCDLTAVPRWPPDTFVIAAALLQESGAYIAVTRKWPPIVKAGTPRNLKEWTDTLKGVGSRWREAWIAEKQPPKEVQRWWNHLMGRREIPLRAIQSEPKLCECLLQLLAATDEASEGIGLPPTRDAFELEARMLLNRHPDGGATLCKELDVPQFRVLPKLHTPQSGLTLNSLSHHLALCRSTDVEPRWYCTTTRYNEHSLNLLLVPAPYYIRPSDFVEVTNGAVGMPDCYRAFAYKPTRYTKDPRPNIPRILMNAERLAGRIDGVILPELSLASKEHNPLRSQILRRGAFLICGVGDPPTNRGAGKNSVLFDVPMSTEHGVSYSQDKHHRWRLDKSQIVQYGLGANLNPECYWWEHIELEKRCLTFVTMRPWLTVSPLICEDLARQHPIADVMRAVGPNLVIALLMDGPQLPSRWPARYATVLADDPGSSVLTFSSLGMVLLSKPPNSHQKCRTVALWKDAKSGAPVPIELPEGASGILLTLSVQYMEEWTADGRSDDKTTGYPILAGIHPVYV